jgi:hypothetical protein
MFIKLIHIQISKLHARCPKIITNDVFQRNCKTCQQACGVHFFFIALRFYIWIFFLVILLYLTFNFYNSFLLFWMIYALWNMNFIMEKMQLLIKFFMLLLLLFILVWKLMFILSMMGIHTLCSPFLGVTFTIFHASFWNLNIKH